MTEPFKNGTLVVYTDGGCSGNPGPGGWACVIVDGEKEETISGGEKLTTNNRMELTAAIEALSAVVQNPQYGGRPVHIFCDSQYVKNGITSWIRSWKKNGWRTAAKKNRLKPRFVGKTRRSFRIARYFVVVGKRTRGNQIQRTVRRAVPKRNPQTKELIFAGDR